MIGETLTKLLCKDRNGRLHELIDNTDMTKNIKKPSNLSRSLMEIPLYT